MNIPLSLVIVVVASALSVGALLLLRSRSPHGGHFDDTGRATGVFGILATSFAVLFAFVVFFAFGSYDESSSSAETEANVTAQQFETAKLLPESDAPELQAMLRCYARTVVNQEWPAMARGETLGLNRWDTELFVRIESVHTTDVDETAAYAKWLDQRSEREEARSERALGEEGVIPAPLWFVLLISGGIVWAFVFMFADRGEGAFVQSVLVATVTAMLAAGFLLIVFLDRPYQPGAGSLKSTAMEQALERMDELTTSLNLVVPELCDTNGDPV